MNPNDFANLLDGWTRLRVDLYDDDTGEYNTIFDSDDHPGYYGDLNNLVNPALEIGAMEVTQIGLEDDHIVLKCEVM